MPPSGLDSETWRPRYRPQARDASFPSSEAAAPQQKTLRYGARAAPAPPPLPATFFENRKPKTEASAAAVEPAGRERGGAGLREGNREGGAGAGSRVRSGPASRKLARGGGASPTAGGGALPGHRSSRYRGLCSRRSLRCRTLDRRTPGDGEQGASAPGVCHQSPENEAAAGHRAACLRRL